MARHRHAGFPARCIELRRNNREATGFENRLARGDRVAPGVHWRQRSRCAGEEPRQERVRRVSRTPAARRSPGVKVLETALPGVLLIELRVFADARGFFFESHSEERYAAAGILG